MADQFSDRKIKLIALHRHWITADAVSYHHRRSIRNPLDFPAGMSEATKALSTVMSSWAVLSVWYSLLFVVLEGFKELGETDKALEQLLTKEDYVDSLRRFRNATFHYQSDPLPQKLADFLLKEESAEWINDVNRVLKAFFERELGIAEGVKAFLNS